MMQYEIDGMLKALVKKVGSMSRAVAFMNAPHLEFGLKSPRAMVKEGRGDLVQRMIYETDLGVGRGKF